jgi:tRNA (mo5U34)-methyltransferase
MGEDLEAQIRKLGPWFHNMNLGGIWTAPDHFLGNYPDVKWRIYADALPQDLRGRTVLDIGCNGGFFSMQMKRRGADRVLGIDFDEAYLAQARFAARVENLDIEFRHMSVYDVGSLGEQFDIVIFIGVFYHLRHPLLALDLIHDHVARDLLIFQSMQRGSPEIAPVAADYDFYEAAHFDDPGYPKMHFIEHRYSGDQTNWWAPNRACTEAMLRSAGFVILSRPEEETYLCRRGPRPDPTYGPVYPAKGSQRA